MSLDAGRNGDEAAGMRSRTTACGGAPRSRRPTPAPWPGSTPSCSAGRSATRSRERRSSPRPQGAIYFVFQQATDYRPPVWPPVDGEQRPMMHFDFQVGDLDSAVADAVALGATLAEHQPQENVRVLLDPAGHPFCLCRDDG